LKLWCFTDGMLTTTADAFDRASLQEMQDVVHALELVEHDLPKRSLPAIRNFNNTYLVITRNVRQARKKGHFANPDFLEQFDVQFAHYYLEALRRYLDNEELPVAWRRAFDSEKDKSSNFKSMALGVNAHINNDIPQVLKDCNASSAQYEDYCLVNKIIRDSIHEVLDNLGTDATLFGPKRTLLRRPYAKLFYAVIRIWRGTAWRNFKLYRGGKLSRQKLEQKAGRRAYLIQRLPV
jgi:hypothetical protein